MRAEENIPAKEAYALRTSTGRRAQLPDAIKCVKRKSATNARPCAYSKGNEAITGFVGTGREIVTM